MLNDWMISPSELGIGKKSLFCSTEVNGSTYFSAAGWVISQTRHLLPPHSIFSISISGDVEQDLIGIRTC